MELFFMGKSHKGELVASWVVSVRANIGLIGFDVHLEYALYIVGGWRHKWGRVH